jgi:hypothetical protein
VLSGESPVGTYINPLAFTEVDEPWAPAHSLPTAMSVLEYLCAPGTASTVSAIVERYREISCEERRLFAVPMDEQVLQKLVWPLRHAKGCYAVGNYLGTIALCGVVAEMVAILLFEMADMTINGRSMTAEDAESLFGATFERLGQERRVKVLSAYGVIDLATKEAFSAIRLARRRYLHLLSKDHQELPADAVKAFNAATSLVVTATGLSVQDGRIAVSAAFVRYLQKGRSAGSS